MLVSFAKRMQSTLVKSEVPADITKVIASGKTVVQ